MEAYGAVEVQAFQGHCRLYIESWALILQPASVAGHLREIPQLVARSGSRNTLIDLRTPHNSATPPSRHLSGKIFKAARSPPLLLLKTLSQSVPFSPKTLIYFSH